MGPIIEHVLDDISLLAGGAGRRAGINGHLRPAVAFDDRDRHRQVAEETRQLDALHDPGMLDPDELTMLALQRHALRLRIDLLKADAPVVTLVGEGLAQGIQALAESLVPPGALQLR